MTDQDKLKQIIEYAVKNGYPHYSWTVEYFTLSPHCLMGWLFDHEFCKAVFGEGYMWISDGREADMTDTLTKSAYEDPYEHSVDLSWQYHIQQLALEEEDQRIEYIYQFMKGKI